VLLRQASEPAVEMEAALRGFLDWLDPELVFDRRPPFHGRGTPPSPTNAGGGRPAGAGACNLAGDAQGADQGGDDPSSYGAVATRLRAVVVKWLQGNASVDDEPTLLEWSKLAEMVGGLLLGDVEAYDRQRLQPDETGTPADPALAYPEPKQVMVQVHTSLLDPSGAPPASNK
jgi:hypothetical protein